jgi:hypothetical protein
MPVPPKPVRPIRGGTRDEPLCSTCTRPELGFWRRCDGCGQPGRLRAGRCAHCRVQIRLHELLADDTGEILGELQVLHDALASHERGRDRLRTQRDLEVDVGKIVEGPTDLPGVPLPN